MLELDFGQPGSQRLELRDSGWVEYAATFLGRSEADEAFDALLTGIPWGEETIHGRMAPRLTAWLAEAGVDYSYSGVTHRGAGWPAAVLPLLQRVQQHCGSEFNSALANLYRDGRDSMGFHADAEPPLGLNPLIASLSLGAERRFVLRHPASGERRVFILAHGSLLVMGGTLQHHWLHALPKAPGVPDARINLTFRRIVSPTRSVGSD